MKLFLVDDHPVVRAGIAALVSGEADMEIVGEAAGADDALRLIALRQPDVVLMDLQLGDGPDGVAATRKVRALDPAPQVLVLTTYETDADIVRAIDAGATGYVLKACPPDELFQAIRAAARGETALSPKVATRMMRRMRDPGPALTAREIEILELLARGAGNREIAKALFVTEATVKTHLNHVYGKLGVDTRTGAVSKAIELGHIRR
ncbi:response regulator [Nonomuraea typhae]|uniref:response regulator n=1 Tax=Nonomuraea typhae TaxID=2603600 RepID=UPI0012FBD0A3|nr:response regulator transcription factor [Nonomuraea typhae]